MNEPKTVNETETLLARKNQTETEEMLDFLIRLSPTEKQNFLSFIRGVKFGKGIVQNTAM